MFLERADLHQPRAARLAIPCVHPASKVLLYQIANFAENWKSVRQLRAKKLTLPLLPNRRTDSPVQSSPGPKAMRLAASRIVANCPPLASSFLRDSESECDPSSP